jgi:hypothetical protein
LSKTKKKTKRIDNGNPGFKLTGWEWREAPQKYSPEANEQGQKPGMVGALPSGSENGHEHDP